jgi:hypothetical protein
MKIPNKIKQVFWSYKLTQQDIFRNQEEIITQVINYGDLDDWKWLKKVYRIKKLREIIANIPKTSFRPSALKLAQLIFKIPKLKYVSRSDRIRKIRISK